MTKILIDRKLAQRIVKVLWTSAAPEVYEEFNAALAAPADDVQKDAARYRWLRRTTNFVTSDGERIDVRNQPELWDSSIDELIAKEQTK